MNELNNLEQLALEVWSMVADRSCDVSNLALKFEELNETYSKEFRERLDSYEKVKAYFLIQRALMSFLKRFNFKKLSYERYQEVKAKFEGFGQSDEFTQVQKDAVAAIFKGMPVVSADVLKNPKKFDHRLDCRCQLCRKYPADKTGSHMVPNFLAHPSFSFDGKGKREREALNFFSLCTPEHNASFYGAEVPAKRIADAEGHEYTDEDIAKNVDLLEVDNDFCHICEDRLGILETAYASFYNGQIKALSPRLCYLFWLSVLWRMSLAGMGLSMNEANELELRTILDNNIIGSPKDIANRETDLGRWKYAIYRCPNLKDGDKGIFGSYLEHAPYIIMVNDLVVIFFKGTPNEEDIKNLPLPLSPEMLNDWHSEEKCTTINRRQFWDVRDFIVDQTFDHFDPPFEEAMKIFRQQTRHTGQILAPDDREMLIKVGRLSHKPVEKPIRIRKLYRFLAAKYFADEAAKVKQRYDIFADERVFLTPKDMDNYLHDLAASGLSIAELRRFPFIDENKIKELRKHLPREENIDNKYLDAYDWFLNDVCDEETREQIQQENNIKQQAFIDDMANQLASELNGNIGNDVDTEYYDDEFYDEPYVRSSPKIGRNDPCPCGSGKKYKKCCGKNRQQ